ncbi:hypothetical protein F5Y03DRAFT_408738, partial [Xylaria venustula]
MLYNHIKQGFRNWCLFAIKTIESITPCPPPSDVSPPPPALPTLSFSAILTAADISPLEIQKEAIVDSSTQTTPPSQTSTGTQCEEGRRDETICSRCSGSSIYTHYIVTGNGIMRVRPDDELPSLSAFELARLQKQMEGPPVLKSALKVSVPTSSSVITEPNPTPEIQPKLAPEVQAEPESETQAEPLPKLAPKLQLKPIPETQPQPAPKPAPEPLREKQPEPVPKLAPKLQLKSVLETEPAPVPKMQPEPTPKPVQEKQPEPLPKLVPELQLK